MLSRIRSADASQLEEGISHLSLGKQENLTISNVEGWL